MDYLFYFLIVVLGLVILSVVSEHKQQKLLAGRLKDDWGTIPETDYTSEKMNSIKSFYLSQQDEYMDVDDITWNDLDMDEIFRRMNNTQSSLGEEYLYALLRKPCFSTEELVERNRLIEYFKSNNNERVKVQTKLNKVGKLRKISAFEYISKLSEEEPTSNLPHYLMALGLLLSIILVFINPSIGVASTLFFMAFNIFSYYKYKARIENFIIIIAFQLRLLDSIEGLMKISIPDIDTYTKSLASDLKTFRQYKRGSSIVVARNVSGSILEAMMDYYRMIFHHDLIKYNIMLSFFKKNKEAMIRIFKIVGFLDSMIAAASFRDMVDYYSLPKLSLDKGNPKLSVTNVYHPLIKNPVPNSINEDSCTLLTGSNASGKSTFIKSLAINAILSQTIYTSLSQEYKASYFTIYSSMALKDNILSNESYFIVEIKSLKRILDNSKGKYPILCFVDEVLRGTNTLERIAASSRILASLAKENALCFAATHDIELTYILEKHYSNYHFRERIEGNQVLFDYKLHKKRAVSKNAIKLLKLLGYSSDIIADAEASADEYMKTGEWSTI
jgi:DNA mismatch repair ATPase MutS